MTRLLLVGCGQIGVAAHLPALTALREEGLVEVIACDADGAKAEAAARQFDVPFGTDWEQETQRGVDAVAVCVPPGPNADIATRALELGLHVLCEKPPGRNGVQAQAMAAAAGGRRDRVAMLGFNRRFSPLYRQALERSLALGPPTSFFGRFTRDALGAAPSNTAVEWLTADSSHALDLAVATMGFPEAVSVARHVVGVGPDNAWTIHLHTAQGSAVVLCHFAAGRQVERYEWAGPGYDALVEVPKRVDWAQSGSDVETTFLTPTSP
jgi:predicted dehydrogenase